MYNALAETTAQLALILSNGADPADYTECAARLAQALNKKNIPAPNGKFWTGQALIIRALPLLKQ